MVDGDDGLDGWNDESAVEVGASNNAEAANKAAGGDTAEEKPAKRPLTGAAKSAAEAKAAREAAAAEPDSEADLGADSEVDEDGKPVKPVNPAKPRIQELTRRNRLAERENQALKDRISELEKNSGQSAAAATKTDVIGPAPDPTDTAKYPLGHLDDRYVDDKLDWLAETKAAKRADEALTRQAEASAQELHQARQQVIQNQIDDLADRGSELDPEFEEKVVKTGMKGDWALSQSTFEAAHEVEHGAQILMDLSQDKEEALRVSKLSVRGQIKYVDEKNDEIAAKAKPRTKPTDSQGVPTQTRGVGSKTKIDPATDDLGEFEKLWAQKS